MGFHLWSACCFAVFITVVYAEGFTTYKDCGSVDGSVQSLVISGCDVKSSHECILKRQTTVTFSIDFTPNVNATAVTTVAQGIIFGAHIPFPLDNPDACGNKNVVCPLQPNKPYAYKASFPILQKYPKISVTVQWELKDQNNRDLVCLQIPAKIQ